MSSDYEGTLGQAIFEDIDENPYLAELYDSLLYNYGLKRLALSATPSRNVNVEDALRFADLLSKSNHPEKREVHRVWAQEIATLCSLLYPENPKTKFYAAAVFTAIGNYQALKLLGADAYLGVLDELFNDYQSDYLAVPGEPDLKFFAPQKRAYDHFEDAAFSYSAPTSLGKSFMMRTFIKSQVLSGAKKNFAIVVPTKALINETRSSLIHDLADNLEAHDYRVVSAAGDIVLEGQHNFIFVVTPERLLYLLISKPGLALDYLFIDEAQKLSGKNSRAPFYYQLVNVLLARQNPPRIVFASPNIPNPDVYLKMIMEAEQGAASLATEYSPVTQFKFFIDLTGNFVAIYNERTQSLIQLADLASLEGTGRPLTEIINRIERSGRVNNNNQTLIFYGAKTQTINNAVDYAKNLPALHDPELEALAKDIERDVHADYYLAGLVRRGVGYHIGYLPSPIRMRLEEMFRENKLYALFCTSTLLEGVNLPADNLVITGRKIGLANMTTVELKNLVGRVGRIRFNLYGNVFFVSGVSDMPEVTQEQYQSMLETKIPDQKLSVDTDSQVLSRRLKESVVSTLSSGSLEFQKGKESYEVHQMVRKFGLILLRDITTNRQSFVREAFAEFLPEDKEQEIIERFVNRATQDDDINVSLDQAERLAAAIQNGLEYPRPDSNGKFNYETTLAFLNNLARIFKWEQYENDWGGLGYIGKNGTSGIYPLLRWYAVLLHQWIEGSGLNFIMKAALEFRQRNPDNFYIQRQKVTFDDSLNHRNVVFGDTLDAIENVILFSLSNYFLRFSNEYKKQKGVETFQNDWYEYVEYGTTNPWTIILQRFGFSRESATYIRRNVENAITQMPSGVVYLNPLLLHSANVNVKREAEEIYYNVPGSFTGQTQVPKLSQETQQLVETTRPEEEKNRGSQ